MSDFAKNFMKTYKIYKTARWIAYAGGVIGSGGVLAAPVIIAAVAEELAERGIEELVTEATEKLFGVVVENIDGETIYKNGEKVITSDRAKELITKGYEKEVGEKLGMATLLDIAAVRDVYLSANAAEEEEKTENSRMLNNCKVLINNFLLREDERVQLNEYLNNIVKIEDPVKLNKTLEQLLNRLRKSDNSGTGGRDLFDDNGDLNLGFIWI